MVRIIAWGMVVLLGLAVLIILATCCPVSVIKTDNLSIWFPQPNPNPIYYEVNNGQSEKETIFDSMEKD